VCVKPIAQQSTHPHPRHRSAPTHHELLTRESTGAGGTKRKADPHPPSAALSLASTPGRGLHDSLVRKRFDFGLADAPLALMQTRSNRCVSADRLRELDWQSDLRSARHTLPKRRSRRVCQADRPTIHPPPSASTIGADATWTADSRKAPVLVARGAWRTLTRLRLPSPWRVRQGEGCTIRWFAKDSISVATTHGFFW